MTHAQVNHIIYRLRILPAQLERARRRVEHLEREAARYGIAVEPRA